MALEHSIILIDKAIYHMKKSLSGEEYLAMIPKSITFLN